MVNTVNEASSFQSPYVPNTDADRRAMLDAIGVDSVDELFADVPDGFLNYDLDLPSGLAQLARQRGQRVPIATRQDHVRALAAHPSNAGASDPGRAGHDGLLSLESHGLPNPANPESSIFRVIHEAARTGGGLTAGTAMGRPARAAPKERCGHPRDQGPCEAR